MVLIILLACKFYNIMLKSRDEWLKVNHNESTWIVYLTPIHFSTY